MCGTPTTMAQVTLEVGGTLRKRVALAATKRRVAGDDCKEEALGPLPAGAYELTLRPVPPDPDDRIDEATPLTLGVSNSGTLENPTDVDMYRFDVKQGDTVIVGTDPPGHGSGEIVFRVFFKSEGKRPSQVTVRLKPRGTVAFRRTRYERQIMTLLERNELVIDRDDLRLIDAAE